MSVGGLDPLRELARIGKALYRRAAEALKAPPGDPALTPARIRDDTVQALRACDVDRAPPPKRRCRLCITPYPADREKLRELLVANGVEKLYDERGQMLLDVEAKKKNVSVRFESNSDRLSKDRKDVKSEPNPGDDEQIESRIDSDGEAHVKTDPDFSRDGLDAAKTDPDSGDDFHEKIKHRKRADPPSHSKHRRKNESESDRSKAESDFDKSLLKKDKHRKKVGFAFDGGHDKKNSSESDDGKTASNSVKKPHKKSKHHRMSGSDSSVVSHKDAKSRKICSDSDNDDTKKVADSKPDGKPCKKIKRIVSSDSEGDNEKAKTDSDSRIDPSNKSKVNSDSNDENEPTNGDSRLESKDPDTSDERSEKVSVSENCADAALEMEKDASDLSNKEQSENVDTTVDGDHTISDDKEYISNSETESKTHKRRKKKKDRENSKKMKVQKQSCKNGKESKDSDCDLKNISLTSNGHESSSSITKSSDEDDLVNGMKNDFVSNCSSLLEKKVMSEVASQIINGDSSNSDEEPAPKVNGKMKKSSKVNTGSNSEMEHSNSHDEKAKAKRSKKSKRQSPVLIDSDSDVRSNGDKVSVKSEDDVKEILGSSESEDSDVFKPSRQRRKKKDSDKSNDESDSDQKPKKKRRRIKNVSGDDSDKSENESGSDTEGDGNKKGRKNIRKVKRSDNLDEATKIAARNERERVQRIAERQKLYNESMFDESGRPDEVKPLDKVVLDFYPESKEPLISVDKGLVEKLKPHQANGVKFMWNACFESVSQIKKGKGSGCILAHCMGLGKTLQIVTLTHTLLTHQKLTKVERVLVVCPLSTVHNWVNEFTMWLKFAKCKSEIDIYEISKYKQNYERASRLKDWLENGGVCVLGYDMFRNLSADNNKKFRKTQLLSFQKALVDPGPDMVVCDEGHLLKNEKTSLSQSMNKVKTLRRIVLTGTPLQNNLKEYYCMVQFVKPNLLGKYNEYLNRFVNPITNGQYTDSTEHDIRVMKRRSHVLHTMLDGAVQRRDYSVLAPFLPPKHEYVLFISLTEIQIKLYSYYMENYSRRPRPDRKNTGFLFPDFQALQRIWTHPLVLKANSERYEIMQQKKREKEEDSEGSLVDFINDDSTTPEETTEDDDSSEDSDDSNNTDKKKKKNKKAVPKRVTRATVVDDDDDDAVIITKEEEPQRIDNPTEWWISLCSEDELDDVRHSNKLILLLDILKECEAIGDKLLVFSQSLYSLDLIEQFLWKIDETTQKGEDDQKLAGHLGSWSPGIDYFRLDGSTSCENRSIWCKNFNREDNPRARLFLISTRAGGLGINLVAANRVVIFDMSWNPSHDVQSIFRVYRFGQKKPCYIYRFLALGTMEEKIYERQVTKQAISKRVIDEQQIDRHYAESDLAELYTFCPVPEGSREVPKLPKDRLFADLLKQHDTMIYKYHEHDSLLENKEEETLTEEERKAAWEDYENEKTRPPAIFGGQVLAGFQQQQQHHLAMSALLQQENPSLSEQQVASMIPGLLQHMYQNGDPSLMQRMTAMLSAQNSMMGFKYPQSTMMNTNLTSMLNAGTGGSTGTYGANSWQQQQQIQLQRLQQQQAMQANLKYYAGGLGSRDTLDMAALQQQQRAMLMASNANLPQRGRPPKNPSMLPYMQPSLNMPKTTPPVTTGDVVDLDSE